MSPQHVWRPEDLGTGLQGSEGELAILYLVKLSTGRNNWMKTFLEVLRTPNAFLPCHAPLSGKALRFFQKMEETTSKEDARSRDKKSNLG